MSYTEQDKERIKELLLDHRGADNTITSRKINDVVEIDNVGSFPGTRAAIRELVMEDEIPIGSNGNGYFIIKTQEELDEYVQHLDERITSTAERRYGVLSAMDAWDSAAETTLVDYVDE